MTSKALFNIKKLARMLSAVDYGLISNGTVDDGPTLVSMGAATGIVVVPSGNNSIKSNITIVGLMVFEPGAYLTIDAGVTLNVYGLVHSPAQYIFRGPGTVLFGDNPTTTNTYSMARVAMAEWFGLVAGASTDQIPALQLAVNAMSNLREGSVSLPMGTINHQTTLYINRCVHLHGYGPRRTVHSMTPNGVIGIVMNAVGARVSGLQFEAPAGTYKSGAPCIDVQANDCQVDDISTGSTAQGIRVSPTGAFCRVSNIINLAQPSVLVAGSSVVEVQAVDTTVEGVQAHSGGGAQYLESIVRVSTNGSGISRVTVKGVDTTVVGAIAVNVVAVNDNMAQVTADGVQQGGANGTGMVVTNSGTAAVQDIVSRNVRVAANATLGMGIYNSGAGSTSISLIDALTAPGGAATGLLISQTAGSIPKVNVGFCNIANATTPIAPMVGVVGDLRVDPLTLATFHKPVCVIPQQINNNSVYVLDAAASVFGSIILVNVNNVEFGMFMVRAASSPSVTPMITSSANVNTTTGALTGTTGVAGKFTVSADATGKIYLENRLGSPANNVQIVPMTGTQTINY